MSYILDALRRADAERARGQIPGLHDQPSLQRQGGSTPRGRPWLWGGAAVALLGVAGGMAWWWARPGTAPPVAVALGTAPAVLVQAAPTPAAAAPAAASAPLPSSDPTAPPAVATARQVSLPQVVSAPEPVAAEPAPSRKAASAAAAAPTARSSVAAVAEGPRVLKLAELSADQRRDMPPLVLGGSVWSESAGSRFVIFNGLLLHEGETAAPGVTVERIGPKSVVLAWRGLRVEIPL